MVIGAIFLAVFTTAALDVTGVLGVLSPIGEQGGNLPRIAVLNADFRGKPQPTNVLSWPSEERGAEFAGEAPEPPEPGAPDGRW